MVTVPRLSRLLALAVVTCLGVGAAHAAAYIKFDGVDGEFPAAGLDIQIAGDAPRIGLLVPAVQKVREAASRSSLATIACAGYRGGVRVAVGDVDGDGRGMLVELMNATIADYGITLDEKGAPQETMSLNFEEVKVTFEATGEVRTYDCSTGRCACTP